MLETLEPVDTDDEDEPDYIDEDARANHQKWMVIARVMLQQGVADAGLGLRDFDLQFDCASARQNYPTKKVLTSFIAQAKQNTLDVEGQYLALPVTLSQKRNDVWEMVQLKIALLQNPDSDRKSESLYKVKQEQEKIQ